ncbi:MAG: YkgJ family cysteine cluster protein [Spirochaetales bacterium]|nr:YkgJ family cysteine cluster protein [Spirochaetales bacterium]
MVQDNKKNGEHSWHESPCSACPQTPCCNHVPVCTIPMETELDLRKAATLLYHMNIEIGLYDTGKWVVYYKTPCRYYDKATTKCALHGTENKPVVCREYPSLKCWYREYFLKETSIRFIRFNLDRFVRLFSSVVFDGSGEICETPDWETMAACISNIPLESGKSLFREIRYRNLFGCHKNCSYPQQANPCSSLVFPVSDAPSLPVEEMLHFRRNFIGIDVTTDNTGRYLVLESPCRFISGRSCRYRKAA